jgi:hypothetical protein
LAAWLAYRLAPRVGMLNAVLVSAVGFLIVYGTLIGLMPSLGDLSANVAHTGQFGYAQAATETPGLRQSRELAGQHGVEWSGGVVGVVT